MCTTLPEHLRDTLRVTPRRPLAALLIRHARRSGSDVKTDQAAEVIRNPEHFLSVAAGDHDSKFAVQATAGACAAYFGGVLLECGADAGLLWLALIGLAVGWFIGVTYAPLAFSFSGPLSVVERLLSWGIPAVLLLAVGPGGLTVSQQVASVAVIFLASRFFFLSWEASADAVEAISNPLTDVAVAAPKIGAVSVGAVRVLFVRT